MKFVHRVSFSSSDTIQRELADLGIEAESSGFSVIKIHEGDPRWDSLVQWANHRQHTDFVTTEFTSGELKQADLLDLLSDWHHGYPQPEDDFGYRAATYDLSEYCKQCGIGKTQVRPFRMKAEPKWGRRSIMQLNWVFDEFFVTPQVWADVFAPFGIGKRPVVDPLGDELYTVVQLVPGGAVDILTEGLEFEVCETCGRTKYLPVQRGMFPSVASKPVEAMVRTNQWFGSGASAHHGVIVPQELRSRLIAAKVRGVSFRPVAP